jgi:hypothetical protein
VNKKHSDYCESAKAIDIFNSVVVGFRHGSYGYLIFAVKATATGKLVVSNEADCMRKKSCGEKAIEGWPD